ncbi:uncharacterized protein [Apostichopus japonicus]|uniref:uncharacterized protein isoform X1 n=1 Tax=Stichopus japonicus TaxID=307972 RepID=UPI003AB73147
MASFTKLVALRFFNCIVIFSIVNFDGIASACPSGCQCSTVTYGSPTSPSGRSVDCNKLYRTYIQSSISTSIFELHFSYNDLRSMPSRLRNFVQLRVLDLSYNKLQVLPNNFFTEDHKLEIFNLSNNYLNRVGNGAFNGLQHLRVLDLERNELRTIPEDVFLPLTNVISSQGEIYLSRNRWKCDCTLWGFMAWFLDHQNTVSWRSTNDEETVCRTPEGLSNRRLHSLSLSELGNCFPTTSVAIPTITTQNDITTTLSITTETVHTEEESWSTPLLSSSVISQKTTVYPHKKMLPVLNLNDQSITSIAMITVVTIFTSVLFVFAVVLWKVAKRQRRPVSFRLGDMIDYETTKGKATKRCHLPLPNEPKGPNTSQSVYEQIPAEYKFKDKEEEAVGKLHRPSSQRLPGSLAGEYSFSIFDKGNVNGQRLNNTPPNTYYDGGGILDYDDAFSSPITKGNEQCDMVELPIEGREYQSTIYKPNDGSYRKLQEKQTLHCDYTYMK